MDIPDFHWLGQTLLEPGIPSFSLLEGGYSKALPELILAYLKGLSGMKWTEADAAPGCGA